MSKRRIFTVGQLIEQLKEYKEDHIVIMSSDAEGNQYSPFSAIEHGLYEENLPYSGERVDSVDGEICPDEEQPDGEHAVFLYPLN
jgi:hypothetical protein